MGENKKKVVVFTNEKEKKRDTENAKERAKKLREKI